MGRLERGLRLLGASARALAQDPELLLVGLVGVIGYAATTWALLSWAGISLTDIEAFAERGKWGLLVLLALASIVPLMANYTIVATVGLRLQGERADVGRGFALMVRRLPSLLVWSLVNAVVAHFMQLIGEKLGLVARIVGFAVSLAWNLATMLVVPVLLFERENPLSAIRGSTRLVRRTWGEGLSGTIALQVVTGFIMLGVMICACVLGASLGGWSGFMPALVVSITLGFSAVMAVSAVFTAVLYGYASTGVVGDGFDHRDLEHAIAARRRRGSLSS